MFDEKELEEICDEFLNLDDNMSVDSVRKFEDDIKDMNSCISFINNLNNNNIHSRNHNNKNNNNNNNNNNFIDDFPEVDLDKPDQLDFVNENFINAGTCLRNSTSMTNASNSEASLGKSLRQTLLSNKKEDEIDNEFKEIDEKLIFPDTPADQDCFQRNCWAPDTCLWRSGPSSLNMDQSFNKFLPHKDLASSVTCYSNEPQSLNTFLSSSKRIYSHQQLGVKVEMVYSLLSMLDMNNREDMSKTFLAMSSSPESCHAMRQSGCLPLLIQLIHSSELNKEVRERAAEALHNIVHSQTDEKRRKREIRVLKLLQQVREYCEDLKNNSHQELPREPGSDSHPINAIGTLMKFSFDAEHRQAICILGGLQAISELIQVDYEAHGNTAENSHCITLRRYAGMSLTNLTFGDCKNKALLCSFNKFMWALVDQLKSPCEDLRQVTASVLRNLSWRADAESKQALRDVGAVTSLTTSAMEAKKESTLKSILSALWNLSAHCSLNKMDICSVPGALAFLVKMLKYRSSSNTLAIVENAGGILRNISSHIAVREDYRQILRDNNCFEVLLEQLKSPSLTIVSNACGTLWNLSARCSKDQKKLWEMGATSMLRSLVQSKHKMISMGSSAALKNLLAANPNENLLTHLDSTAKSLGLQNLPALFVRKKRALEQELNITLAETCENIDSVESPTHVIPPQSDTDLKKTGPRRSESRDSVQSTHSDSAYERINQITLKNKEKLFENKNATLHDSLDETSMSRKLEDQKLMRRYNKCSMIPTPTFKKVSQNGMFENSKEELTGDLNAEETNKKRIQMRTNCKSLNCEASTEQSSFTNLSSQCSDKSEEGNFEIGEENRQAESNRYIDVNKIIDDKRVEIKAEGHGSLKNSHDQMLLPSNVLNDKKNGNVIDYNFEEFVEKMEENAVVKETMGYCEPLKGKEPQSEVKSSAGDQNKAGKMGPVPVSKSKEKTSQETLGLSRQFCSSLDDLEDSQPTLEIGNFPQVEIKNSGLNHHPSVDSREVQDVPGIVKPKPKLPETVAPVDLDVPKPGVDAKEVKPSSITPKFKVGSPITNTNVLQMEANKICREIRKHQDFEMGCSLTSDVSLISSSSFLDTGDYSLFEGSTEVVDFNDLENVDYVKVCSKIGKSHPLRKSTTFQAPESVSLPSLESLKNEPIEDLDSSILSVASITSEIAESLSKDFDSYNTYTKTYKVDGQKECFEQTLADATLISNDDDTLYANSLQNNPESFDEDNSIHSQENLPLDAENFKEPDRTIMKMTPKEKRKTFNERYRTYTIRDFNGCKASGTVPVVNSADSTINSEIINEECISCGLRDDNLDHNDLVNQVQEEEKVSGEKRKSGAFDVNPEHETFLPPPPMKWDKEHNLNDGFLDSKSLNILLTVGPAERKELVDNAKLVAFSLKTAVHDCDIMSDPEVEEPHTDIDTATYNKNYRRNQLCPQFVEPVQNYEEEPVHEEEEEEKKGARILKPGEKSYEIVEEIPKGIRGRRKQLYSSPQKYSHRSETSPVSSSNFPQTVTATKKQTPDAGTPATPATLQREGTFTKEEGPTSKKTDSKIARSIPVLFRNPESKNSNPVKFGVGNKFGLPSGNMKRVGENQGTKIRRPTSVYSTKPNEKRTEGEFSRRRPFSAETVNRSGRDGGSSSRRPTSAGPTSPKMRNSSSSQNVRFGNTSLTKSKNFTSQSFKSQSDASLNLDASKDKVSAGKQRTPKKDATSKIASLWRKVEESKQKGKNSKDNRVWISSEKNSKPPDEVLVVEREEILDIPTRKIVHSLTCQTLSNESSPADTHSHLRYPKHFQELSKTGEMEERKEKTERRNVISAVVPPYNYNPPVSEKTTSSKVTPIDNFHKGSLKITTV